MIYDCVQIIRGRDLSNVEYKKLSSNKWQMLTEPRAHLQKKGFWFGRIGCIG